MSLSEEALVLRRCGYYQTIVASEERTVVFPRENVLDGQALMRLMRLARRREPLQ